jgi:uncharacterized protein YjiK
VELTPTRIEDVPVPELSGLALQAAHGAGPANLLAIGDRKSVLARAALTDGQLEWARVDLDRLGPAEDRGQFEGIAVTTDGRILVLCENPPLVLVLDPRGDRDESIALGPGDRGKLDGLDDISDLEFADGVPYCLSDQSRRVAAVELPLDPGSDRARINQSWELSVPERRGEPDGKPEGLAVSSDRTLLVGLDTETPHANLCWYRA